jgi:hypothetical protein
MEEGNDLLDHINNVKEFVNQLAWLEVTVREEDIVMTLPESLPTSYENSNHRLGNNGNKGIADGLCDGTFDAQDVQT